MEHTITYAPLESGHIRLLEILRPDNSTPNHNEIQPPKYRIVHKQLPTEGTHLSFEAASYTWGAPSRVSHLPVEGSTGTIGLTKNLTEALPHLTAHSTTGFLWIDQICINQSDNAEKGIQVALMSQIYKAATRVIVWLGPEDESSHICKEWLSAVQELINTTPERERLTPGTPTYNPSFRELYVRSTFSSPITDPKFAPAVHSFFQRPWFTRGWIVQEFLLARSEILLTGPLSFTTQDLADLWTIPPMKLHPGSNTDMSTSYYKLLHLKLHPIESPQPLRFLRHMVEVTQEFSTFLLADTLYANLGLIEGTKFVPDYTKPIQENFTWFVLHIAETFGAIDFLSLCDAHLNPLVPSTPPELLGFPSWVPSWHWVPLSAPLRLAVGGSRAIGGDILWNACNNRKHIPTPLNANAVITGKFHVRGRIIDAISHISSARFTEYYNVSDEYLSDLVGQIKNDIAGLEDWEVTDMLYFLNTASYNGHPPKETGEQVLSMDKGNDFLNEVSNANGFNDVLSLCLAMGRGRRFMRTEKGRLGLAPAVGIRAGSEGKRGSVIAILHGCIVPIMLEVVDEEKSEYKVLGDCFVEGAMLGDLVDWEEDQADTFVLV